MLAAAAARLMRPALVAAMARWRGEWQAEENLRLLRDRDELSRVRSELEETRRAHEEALGAQAEAAALELARQRDLARDSLSAAERGAAEAHGRELETRLEAEKEKRIAHLSQLAARRVSNREIATGFITWQEQWAEATRQKRMLAAAGARLARPALAAALALWVGEWREAEREQLREAASKSRSELEAELADLRAEVHTLQLAAKQEAASRQAEVEERLRLQAAAAEFAHGRDVESQLEAQREKRIAHLSQLAARRVTNREIATGFGTWQEQWAEAARQKRMLAAAGARLARPALAAAM